MRALSSLGVGGGKEAVLEGPILLALLVFAIELARLREHTLRHTHCLLSSHIKMDETYFTPRNRDLLIERCENRDVCDG